MDLKKLYRIYGRMLAEKPTVFILTTLLVSAAALYGASLVEKKSMETRDMLPEKMPVIDAINYIEDEYGSTEYGLVVLTIDPEINSQGEVRDLREPDAVEYVDVLTQKISMHEHVAGASSIASIIRKQNNDILPKNIKEIKEILEKIPSTTSYLTDDSSTTLIRFTLRGAYDKQNLLRDLRRIVDETPAPVGVSADVTGQFAVSAEILEQIGPDMAKTSMFSMAGICLVVAGLFRSVRLGLISLSAILFGSIWAFGALGFLDIALSSTTSGAMSMIMGIGIDFGIQVASRYKNELSRHPFDKAMEETISGVARPMLTTTLAALIGFRAMSLGELTVLNDLGNIMSLGVLFCMFSALTVVPTFLIISEKYFNKNRRLDAKKWTKKQ